MAQSDQPSVLLVDDAPANLLALQAILESLNLRLVEARSGPEAVQQVQRQTFALVLLDVQMPGMDGFKTAERLRALPQGSDLPILFVTAIYVDEQYVKRGYALGGADYIIKPLDPEILRARVLSYAGLFRQREEIHRSLLELRTRERDEAQRRLAAFERIATAALETDDLDTFLQSLLGVFLSAADSAETVSILLRKGNALVVRASIGLAEGGVGFSIPVGHGFAGRIAASGVAELLVGQAIASNVQGPLQRMRGLRALYGAPLASDGQIIGVAHIGATRDDSFTEAEMSIFRALVDRAAWAVSRAYARRQLFDVLDAAPVSIGVFRAPNFVCEFANEAFRYGYGGREVVGLSTTTLGATPETLALYERVAGNGETVTLKEHAVTSDWKGAGVTEERFVQLSLHPLRDAIGRLGSVLAVAIDLTPQVLLRRALESSTRERGRLLELEQAARNEAEIASAMKDEFLATVSHELRTPLNSILGWVTNARRGITKDLDRVLGIVERNARALARIVDDVLDLSRVASGKLQLNIVSMDFFRVLFAAAEAVQPAADAKGIKLDVRVADNLGGLVGDSDRLQQVIWNLLSNAVKFTPMGGRVELTARKDEAKIVVRVVDTGQGIDPRFLPYIFDAFRQEDASSTRRHGGLGLGLAIAKRLAVAHGGTIYAESEGPGRGATFTLELPARMTPAAPTIDRTGSRDAMRASVPPPPVRLDALRVLVVDDHADFRELVGEFLRHHGAEVELAQSAREALGKVPAFQPNVIVSDLGMPDEDGYWFIRKLRGLSPGAGGRIPALALTAYARAEDRELALASGYDEHLPKPVELTHLADRLAEWGTRQGQRAEDDSSNA